MRIIVTRPERDARRWAADFAAQGHDAVVLPLIEIAALRPDCAPAATVALADAWRRLADLTAVMFVSSHAVDHFFASQPADVAAWPVAARPRAWAPGPGTVKALHGHGLPQSAIDGPAEDALQFDSERLWQQVAPQVSGISPPPRVLFVRGGDSTGVPKGRDWLARQVAAVGGHGEEVVAYERRLPVWTPAQSAQAAAAAADGSTWLFSSSEAVGHLLDLLPQQDWGHARALATHPRIAQAARDAGFGVVCESRPAWSEVLASIESTA